MPISLKMDLNGMEGYVLFNNTLKVFCYTAMDIMVKDHLERKPAATIIWVNIFFFPISSKACYMHHSTEK